MISAMASASTMNVAAVLFDIGDTLWHAASAPPPSEFRRMAADRATESLARLGVSGFDPAVVSRVAWDAMEAAAAVAKRTDLAEPDYAVITSKALREIGLELRPEDALALLDSIYVSGAEGGKEAYPDARKTLDELRRRGFKLGIVTNRSFGGERFRTDLRDACLDIPWDTVAVSVEVGFLKPHPGLFIAALEALDVAPSETLMVGNSLAEDIAGAQALGMHTAWKRSKPDADGVTPDIVFDNVSELLDHPLLEASA